MFFGVLFGIFQLQVNANFDKSVSEPNHVRRSRRISRDNDTVMYKEWLKDKPSTVIKKLENLLIKITCVNAVSLVSNLVSISGSFIACQKEQIADKLKILYYPFLNLWIYTEFLTSDFSQKDKICIIYPLYMFNTSICSVVFFECILSGRDNVLFN